MPWQGWFAKYSQPALAAIAPVAGRRSSPPALHADIRNSIRWNTACALQVFQPAAPFAAALLAAAPSAPVWWNVWSSSFIMLVCMSQQFHAWSHMKPSELPAPVVALQVGRCSCWGLPWVGALLQLGRDGLAWAGQATWQVRCCCGNVL